jgi:hypothetical protein
MKRTVSTVTPTVKVRKYSGPAKGSQEAKDRMARVRAAQWEKNGLIKNPSRPDNAELPRP